MSAKILALGLLVTAAFIASDKTDDKPQVPANAYELYPAQGIASSMKLTSWRDNGRTKYAIIVSIKNVSSGVKCLLVNGPYYGISIYYRNSSGKTLPLREYDDRRTIVEGLIGPVPVGSGHTIEHAIEIDPEELPIVNDCPIQCRFRMYDPSEKQGFDIQSAFEMLAGES